MSSLMPKKKENSLLLLLFPRGFPFRKFAIVNPFLVS